MAAILSIGKGYDPDYLTESVGRDRENYYLSAVRDQGEPPGFWSGAGARALGLEEGSEVDSIVMEKLYSEFFDIRNPNVFDDELSESEKPRLGRKPAKYMSADDIYQKKLAAEPEATDERKQELLIQSKKEERKALQFFDLTFSAHKSVTLTHAGLLALAQRAEAAGDHARAEAARAAATEITEALKEAAAVAVDEVRQVASHARVGYHGKKVGGVTTGRWDEAGDWVVASFLQHTSRNGDPQLHVHQAVLNRQLCRDGKWRSLDGQAIYRARAAASAIAERTLMERLTRTLGVRWVPAADGQNFAIEGVSTEQITEFSTRRVEVTTRVQELAQAYERRYGYAPNARALFSLAQQATKDTKSSKKKLGQIPSAAEELEAWEKRTREKEIDSLSSIPTRALFRFGQRECEQASAEMAALDMDRVLEMALADCQKEKSTFSRYELTRHISRHLPACFGGLPTEAVRRMMHEMTDAALDVRGGRVLRYTMPDVVALPDSLLREGRSVFRDPSYERWSTPEQLEAEERFLRSAAQVDCVAVDPERAADRLGIGPVAERGSTTDRTASATDTAGSATESENQGGNLAYGLSPDQASAVYGVLTSGRRCDVLEGYAGAGKSYTVARLAELWREMTGGTVVGLTTAQSAAQVLQDEGMDQAVNIARWIKNGKRLAPGQLVVVDESSMVTTDHLSQIQDAADRVGAKVLLTGDSEQLSAPGAGGLMRLLVSKRGSYKLTEIFRFRNEWEKNASIRLRAGDEEVLSTYEAHGRLRGGTREEMENGAVQAYLADHLAGRESLLLTTTNGKAAELAGRVREALVSYGLVNDDETVPVRGGNRVGAGDLITARRNDKGISISVNGTWRTLTNRDRLAVTAVTSGGAAWACLIDQEGRRGEPILIPSRYVERDIELAYSGTAHAGQGRTVDTCHAVVDEGMSRQALYVEMSRGRYGNWAWTITDTESADLRPAENAPSTADTSESTTDGAATTAEQQVQAEGAPAREAGVDQDAIPGLEAAEPEPESTVERTASATEVSASGAETTAATTDRDAIGVLAQVLETDQADQTATETLRIEVERVTHMAHLGSMWQSLVKEDLAEQTYKALNEILPEPVAARLETDSARGNVVTAVRQAVLGGHDLRELIERASEETWEGVRSIGQALHARIERIIGTGDTELSTWSQATPKLAKPDIDHFVREVATKMDEHVHELGERAAAEPPAYLVERLGEVPDEIMARTEWIQRAGKVEAYREQYGNERETTNILGAAPDRNSPEQRMSWFAAARALGRDARERAVTAARDGALWVQRAAYARAAQWAPPHVGDEMGRAATERDDRYRESVRLRAQADVERDEQVRQALLTRAAAAQELSHAAAERHEQLSRVQADREAWVEATETMRQDAMLADAELHRRHTDLDLPPLHQTSADEQQRAQADAEPTDPRDQISDGQETLFGLAEAGPVRRRGLRERPDPEPQRAAEPGYVQQELDLGLAEAPVTEGDSALRRALEQAAAARSYVSGLLRRGRAQAEREQAGRDAGQEPTREERVRDERYRDDLARREEAELERRRQQQAQKEPQVAEKQQAPEREQRPSREEALEAARVEPSRRPRPTPPERSYPAPPHRSYGPDRGHGPSL